MTGVDAYVSRSFQAEELYAAVEHLGTGSLEAAAPSLDNRAGSDPIDHEASLKIVGGSAECFTTDDLDVVKRALHCLKGRWEYSLPSRLTRQRKDSNTAQVPEKWTRPKMRGDPCAPRSNTSNLTGSGRLKGLLNNRLSLTKTPPHKKEARTTRSSCSSRMSHIASSLASRAIPLRG